MEQNNLPNAQNIEFKETKETSFQISLSELLNKFSDPQALKFLNEQCCLHMLLEKKHKYNSETKKLDIPINEEEIKMISFLYHIVKDEHECIRGSQGK
jgi:hypothetical protein